jgi:hypothetical protein
MSEPGNASALPAGAPPAKPAPPPARALPDEGDLAAWVEGAEVPVVGALFEQLDLARFDLLVTQVRKEELLPQHWQVIAARSTQLDDADFDRLAEVRRLERRLGEDALFRRRAGALCIGWRELGGKRPGLWEAADFFAAWRRILQHRRELRPYDLLTALRDVWRDHPLPRGREQLAILWSCLVQVRKVTKK